MNQEYTANNDAAWLIGCGHCGRLFEDSMAWAKHQVEQHGARWLP